MSKIGKKSIAIPAGVTVEIKGNEISVKGSKGTLKYDFLDGVIVKQENNEINVSIDSEEKKNLWGLTRTLIMNMVEGVQNGYSKKMMVFGVGYTAKVQGKQIILTLGFSHPVKFDLPEGITASAEKDPKGNDIITIGGIDKQLVGEICAKFKDLKKPEPYKGKGIRYLNEVIKLKAGKTAKK